MASIDNGNAHGGRRTINQELALVPFIDLLLCCVMFLLVTAVWAELGQMGANLPGAAADSLAPHRNEISLEVAVSQQGFVVRSNIGTEIEIPAVDGEPNYEALRTQAHRFRMDTGQPYPVELRPDDDIGAGTIVGTMDVLRGEGFTNIGFADS